MADGFDAAKAGKLKRAQAWKKLRGRFALCCLLPVLCMAVLWICFNLEANSTVLKAVFLMKVWRFCSSQLFLFALINVIVIILVVLSGSLRPSNGREDFYDEFVRKNQAARKEYGPRPVADNESAAASEAEQAVEVSCRSAPKNLQTAKSFSGTARPRGQRVLRRLESAEIKQRRESCKEVVVSKSLIVISKDEDMPDEELQRRSDEFIAKFRREIRQGRLELSG